MENNENTGKKTIYEIGFLLLPTIAEGMVAGEFGTLKSKIEEIGGVAISEEFPQLIDLAYEMSKTLANKKTKFTQAYFGWIKFELDPSKINAVKVFADGSEKILRSLIITTVRENTVIGKKFVQKGDRKKVAPRNTTTDKKEGESEEVAEEVNPEELDKKIDDLVTE